MSNKTSTTTDASFNVDVPDAAFGLVVLFVFGSPFAAVSIGISYWILRWFGVVS